MDHADEIARKSFGLAFHPAFQSLVENNLANKDRINYLRKLDNKPIAYLARGKAKEAAAFENIKIQVLAPEQDVSVYYTANARERAVLVSTKRNVYGTKNPVPDDTLLIYQIAPQP